MKQKKVLAVVITVLALLIIGFIIATNRSNNSTSTATSEVSYNSPDTQEVAPSNTYTLSEVAKHNTENDCWTVVDGSVYDITSVISSHPGGKEIIRACGVDSTTLFKERKTTSGEAVGSGTPHSSSATQVLEENKIGTLSE